jgi:HK97 family phage major capsid protein
MHNRESLSLRRKRASLLDTAEAICLKAETENRGFTDVERRDIDNLRRKSSALMIDIERIEGARTDSVGLSDPLNDMTGLLYGGGSDRACGEFENLGEMLQCVRSAAFHPSLTDSRLTTLNRAAAGAAGSVPSDGGFLVQSDFSGEVLKKVHMAGQLVQRVRHIPISANANGLRINAVDESSRATGSRNGGVQVYWAAEAGTTTAKKPKFRQIQMDLQKLFGLFYATDELMQDTTALAVEAERSFLEEFAFTFDDCIFRGDGVGKPLGILNAPATISVAKETNQASATITTNNLLAMWSRLAPGSESNAIWLVNKDCWPQLPLLNIPVSTAGGALVFMPAGGISGNQYSTLLGRPVVVCEQASTLGTVGDIVLADLSEYLWIEKGGIQAASSIHVQFLTDEMVFRWTVRVNGQPIWNKPLTPYQGTNTVSPFITLAAR